MEAVAAPNGAKKERSEGKGERHIICPVLLVRMNTTERISINTKRRLLKLKQNQAQIDKNLTSPKPFFGCN